MQKKVVVLLFAACLVFFSCDDTDPEYADFLVATPLVMSSTEFKANAVAVTDPIPIQNSGKIYAYQNFIFVGDVGKGVHVIDNTNPQAPGNIAFIKIEGNADISIKNNRLFADSYGDLVVFDISDINDIHLVTRLENAINDDYYFPVEGVEWPEADIYEYDGFDYTSQVIVGWEVTTERRKVEQLSPYYDDYALDNAGAPEAPTGGQGGSLARFKIVADYLYVVDYSNINVFDISDLESPVTLEDVQVAWDIETIFNQGDVLFIGGQQGMYIYDISAPAKPVFVSEFRHGTACDPVVVDGNYAFVTLRGGNACGGTQSGLYIVDISDLTNPELEKFYPMVEPYGLGFKGEKLFICDGSDGLKVYDKSNVLALEQLNHFKDINTYDVIPLQNSLLMIGDKVLYQYDYIDNGIQLLSTFEL